MNFSSKGLKAAQLQVWRRNFKKLTNFKKILKEDKQIKIKKLFPYLSLMKWG